MIHFRIFLLFLGLFAALPFDASANSVVDIYNIVRRQMMKNEEMAQYLDYVRNGSPDLKTLMGDYKTDLEKDWLLEDPKDKDSDLLNYAAQIQEVNKILGPYGSMGDTIATELITCILGENEACKDIVETNYKPIIFNSLAELNVLEYLFADPENGEEKMFPDGEMKAVTPGTEADFQKWVEENMTSNYKNTKSLNTSELHFEVAMHNALAQGYGIAVVARRSAEIFDETVPKAMNDLIKDMNPKNIREDIHLIIAMNSQIIYQLGQINAIQGVISEIGATTKIGAVQGVDGVLKTNKDEK